MIVSIVFFIIISFASGIILTVAGKVLEVKIDDRVERLNECLPGINCGACGYSGCERYAVAVIAGEAEPNQCKPGGEECVEKISKVLGVEVKAAEPDVAFVHCSGSCSVKYDYRGTVSCRASELYYNGMEECRFGCAGLGDCVYVCPEEAIVIKDNLAVVIPSKCNACGLCVKACPKKIITIQKARQSVHVMCGSKDIGKITKAACKSGCLGCRICEKKCPKEAIIVRDNCAVINGELCDNCTLCVSVCPTKCIAVKKECEAG
ncbi:MAG: RnfABCDGE type electron transport complex subunit B [Oscillospiraceae bacterium]|nr:RnfABCDGE type electron transport complex subunit B [Oscillospiraceae bacterium]